MTKENIDLCLPKCAVSRVPLSQAELTFCTGDIITVFGEIDEDGFYYVSWFLFGRSEALRPGASAGWTFPVSQGELNGQKGLVPSNFLEEVPDDVEVFLSDAPSRYAHDTPTRAKAKRVSNQLRKT